MFGYKSIQQQLVEERSKTSQLEFTLEKANADLYYIAMMTDVDLEEDVPSENLEV